MWLSLADPAAFSAGGPGQQLSVERGRVQATLAEDYERWEALELELEEVTEAARTG